MANITIRNIPDDVFEKIKALSSADRRSINSELLLIIERGTSTEYDEKLNDERAVSKSTQLDMWTKLLGSWEDSRSTEDIIHGIYSRRTLGRKVKL
jgi:plasmid stability protein